jgi:NADH-quinone oxidoreductase subunit E
MAFEVSSELEKKIDEVITHYPVSKRSAVLPLLHLIQHEFRYIQDEAVNWVAAKLGLTPFTAPHVALR